MRSAERLFAEKGLSGVSVKDITRAAGAKNPSALHYHFGNIETLLKEIFAERYAAIERARMERLYKVKADNPETRLVVLLEAALAPFIETCLEKEGRLYVRFCVQLFTDPRFNPSEIMTDAGSESIVILRGFLLDILKHIPEDVLTLRLRQALMIAMLQADDFARRIEAGTAPTAKRAVRESAICLAGYLSAQEP